MYPAQLARASEHGGRDRAEDDLDVGDYGYFDTATYWTSYGVRSGPLKGLRLGGGIVRAVGPIQQFGTSNSRFVVENGYTTVGAFARYQTSVRRRPLSVGVNLDNATNEFYIRSRAGVSEPRRTVFSARLDF
jgi:outer membrane receptor for ferric coprogen and ferric-rhodotorulic acid